MLKPRKKMSKKEIQEDPFVTFMVNAQKTYEKYAKPIQYGLLAVVAVIVISTLMVRSKRQAEIQAAGRLGIAENYINSSQWDQATPELESIVESYAGTRAAGRAVLYLAKAALAEDNKDKAEKNYRLYASKYKEDLFLRASAMAGVAACSEDDGRYAEAIEWYEKAFKQDPKSFKAPLYLKSAARCATRGVQRELARTFYQRIVDEYPDSPEAREVKVFLAAL